MRKTSGFLAMGAALLMTVPAAVEAQQSADASINVTAEVLANIDVNAERDLQFPAVLPGFSETVSPASANAGAFRIQGAGSSEVSVSFTLPSDLQHADGVATLPLSFGSESAGFGNVLAAGPTQLFNPNATSTTLNLSGGERVVFIGGQINAGNDQLAGQYSGQITLDVAYTGS